MVRRMATEPKTGFTGVALVASFAICKVLMAISNAGINLPWPFCRWESSVMVEMQGECEEAVRKNPSGNRYERPSRCCASAVRENDHTTTAANLEGAFGAYR